MEHTRNVNKIAPLFAGWDRSMLCAYLQGTMGYALLDHEKNPCAAQLVIGDFCFFAGKPCKALVQQAAAPILVPQNDAWEQSITSVWGTQVSRQLRYATKKEAHVFDLERLRGYSAHLETPYSLHLFQQTLYHEALRETWSKDLCSQFADYATYHEQGLGVAVLEQGHLVAGASSYTVYPGGIEIEIDTKPDFRRRGLATACGARLILECLARNLYPSWDAHDLRSLALAEKLGYHFDRAYPVYLKGPPLFASHNASL